MAGVHGFHAFPLRKSWVAAGVPKGFKIRTEWDDETGGNAWESVLR
jgi:hypothetical protein